MRGHGSDGELGELDGQTAKPVKHVQLQVIGVREQVGGICAGLVGPLQDGCGGHDGCTCRLAASSRMACSG
jgi:hypothetical protein